jgi:polyribonucleotide nucleotidyltransferase
MIIPKDMIGAVIGPGGKIIQSIQEASGAVVTIDEINNEGHIEISAANLDSIKDDIRRIKSITAQPEEGETYTGVVKSILPFGAFVEILPGKDGLLHISEISWDRLESMETSGIHEGDEVTVKLIEIDKKTGKYRLSMKALLPRPERAPRSDRHSRNDNNQ